ncbi:hypothetical protein CJ179_38685 [Rhodococcus sp. ACS1]|uniref:NUMOD4 motif-containing HNH endonuclease n=1 Tax=Rhodococcus sp. ACS1 TaxID=2028570 RepID=UPI000BB0F176|nr:NUMOD4 motif-containing HNH endonuclease [Rhodococcus sp. ACS1]PBC38528.1 hypothetical protein CJ179_38685 [Rhodococcus sp. ACS1]
MIEIWKPVVDFEGLYEVSVNGRVRSLDREVVRSDGKTLAIRGQMITPWINEGGYLRVNLADGGKRVKPKLHRLVLAAFVGPCPEGMEGCHDDGNPLNNVLSNLFWGTHSRNIQDQVRHGTHNQASKEACPRGHALREPNLASADLRRGKRSCRACGRARAYLRRYPGLDLQAVSDQYYADIMSTTKGLVAA